LPLAPSIGVDLSQSLITPDERWFAIQASLDLLMAGEWRRWRETLLRTMVACPQGAFVSQVVVQLGRNLPALQVSVKRLRPTTIARYLEYLAWSGDIAAAAAQARSLFRFADHLTLCLEVGEQIEPCLAYECSLNATSATEPRWGALLDELVAQELCTTAKRDGFLAWAGMTTPLITDQDWPDQLIVESFSHPANHLSVIQRRFGQVKVASAHGERMEATGALRFIPQWLKL
jgi:hypothetical protein